MWGKVNSFLRFVISVALQKKIAEEHMVNSRVIDIYLLKAEVAGLIAGRASLRFCREQYQVLP